MSRELDTGPDREDGDERTVSTVALAVDGMEPSLVERWIETDDLPNLRELRDAGAYGTADCSSLSSAKQWTTHFTGVTADDHGITGFTKVGERRAGDPAPDTRELVNLSDIRVETYPELLSERGIAVGLVNPLPLWPPLELAGGFCVSGLLAPPGADRWVHPPELETVLRESGYRIDVRYGDRPYGFVDDDLFEEVSLRGLYEDLFDVLDARIRFTKRAVVDRDVDYLYCLLKSIDVIQHCFWVHMANGDPTYGDAILESYRRVDDLVGWLRTETDANLLVFSDHGFGPRMNDPPEGLHSVARAVARRVTVPWMVREAYDAVVRRPVGTHRNAASVSRTTGTHADPAVWMLAGPEVESTSETSIDFEDLPPTILALLGVPVPESYVGAPLDVVPEPAFEDRSLAVRRDTVVEDEEIVSERLHNLGYAEMVDEG